MTTQTRWFAGTSGYSYKEWRGTFYPEDMTTSAMLPYYAVQLPAVEINNTFYRMPNARTIERWVDLLPDGFRLVLKASRRITHFARLGEIEEPLGYLLDTTAPLGDLLAAHLFQLPPQPDHDPARS